MPVEAQQSCNFVCIPDDESQTVGYAVRTIQFPGGTRSVPYTHTVLSWQPEWIERRRRVAVFHKLSQSD